MEMPAVTVLDIKDCKKLIVKLDGYYSLKDTESLGLRLKESFPFVDEVIVLKAGQSITFV